MTNTTPDLTIPGPALAELRVQLDALNKVLAELAGRVTDPESETAGLLRVALDNAQEIAETLEGVPGNREEAGKTHAVE